MTEEVDAFTGCLEDVRRSSKNTVLSYRRDLLQMFSYLEGQGITELSRITRTSLNSYILYLEGQGKAAATISRVVASMKGFFHYEMCKGRLRQDPSEQLKTPRIEKKAPVILTVEEVERLLQQPEGETPKELRDKAMLELLYATGIRVSELINLKLEDVNLQVGFISCRDGQKERVIPFGKTAGRALRNYLTQAREELLKGRESSWLFTNCNGSSLSRQGFWKIVKQYGEKAGILPDITPHMLRHSFAVHLIRGGADLQSVRNMLGHVDLATTQMYMSYMEKDALRLAYSGAHPRE